MDLETLIQTKTAAVAEATAAADLDALEAVRIKYLGRKGLLPEIMKSMKDIPNEQKKEFGQTANALKNELNAALDTQKGTLSSAGQGSGSDAFFDYTLPGQWRGWGSAHPISQIIDRVSDIFATIGFTLADGPDIEDEFHNFDALNTPEDHPSKDMHDTFYLDTGELLRTHTSPGQIRYMQDHQPPVRILVPGRCYRRDTEDATHSANFHQVEGLYINKEVSMAELKGDLTYFAQQIVGDKAEVRFRPHFFPFTEPSVEVDFTCHVCASKPTPKGCRVCKESGWIEIAGAGMVDPNVLKAVGYDPDQVTGYAFGMGIERIAMIMLEIDDIRRLYENDVRFLAQF